MNRSVEDFAGLRRLLKLKRHEAPPPGYFQRFSAQVIARIEQEERAEGIPWWRCLFGPLNTPRILAGANVLTIAGLAFVGVSLYLVMATDPVIESASDSLSGAGLLPFSSSDPLALPLPSSGPSVTHSFTIVLEPLALNPRPAAAASVAPAVDEGLEAARALFRPPTLRSLDGEQVGIPVFRQTPVK